MPWKTEIAINVHLFDHFKNLLLILNMVRDFSFKHGTEEKLLLNILMFNLVILSIFLINYVVQNDVCQQARIPDKWLDSLVREMYFLW